MSDSVRPQRRQPTSSPVPGILQTRTLEWVAISFSSACKWKVKVKSFSHIQLFKTPWTAAYQAPLPMGFSRQEYWSGVPLPSLKTNPREYQIVRTQTKETTWIQDPASPNTSNTLYRMPHLNKQNKYTNPIVRRQDYHLTQPCPSEEKLTNKQKLSTNLTLYEAYTNTGPNLGRQKAKERKNSTLKPGKRRPKTQ